MATFRKHRGEWCVFSTEPLEPGATVEVTKRNGKLTTVTIDEILQTGDGWNLASIISDRPTLTTRERKEAKVERLREWAESREGKADVASEKAHEIHDMIPFGQPILVGHHSEKRHRRDLDRIDSNLRQSRDHSQKADEHRQRADSIERELATSIYSDDVDAVDQLRAKIERLEAQRDRIKAYNASCRKGERDPLLLDEKQRADLASTARVASYMLGKKGEFPAYALTNLSSNINRNKKRLAALEARG